MRKCITCSLILFSLLFISCSNNPAAKIQGVYKVDKESLKENLSKNMEDASGLASGLLNLAMENAVQEFQIEGDSVKGLFFMAGETTLLEGRVIKRNDSLIISSEELVAHIIPIKTGLTYSTMGSDATLTFLKTDQTELSKDTKAGIIAEKVAVAEKKEFEESIGKWQLGYYVDDFGDRTGDGYVYGLFRGKESSSSSTLDDDVYIKAMIMGNDLYLEIFNTRLSRKKPLPDQEFGTMKIKFPDDSVESQRVFFYDNTFSEFGDDMLLFDFIKNNDGEVKVLIDLSTASRYYSDKYNFTIQRANLLEMLEEVAE